MIETLLAHHDAIPYTLAVGYIVLATAMASMLLCLLPDSFYEKISFGKLDDWWEN